jgi:hypothetical protein
MTVTITTAKKWYQKKIVWDWVVGIVLVLGFIGYQYHHHQATKLSCNNPQIKGNISYSTGAKIYHLPGERLYNKTVIDTSAGERMFCTEKEAQAAGWRHTQEQ